MLINGNTIAVAENVHVAIDCDPLIDIATIGYGFLHPTIRWYKNGTRLPNVSAVNVLISESERLCIITNTLASGGGQHGTDGNYTCEICDNTTCISNLSQARSQGGFGRCERTALSNKRSTISKKRSTILKEKGPLF